MTDSSQYETFRRENNARSVNGHPIDHIYGIKNGKSELHGLRYRVEHWTEQAAHEHCQKEGGKFEPAIGKGKTEVSVLEASSMAKLNPAGNSHANSLIDVGKYDATSAWSISAEEENAILGNPADWPEYSRWHLGIDDSAPKETKGRYKYPHGKKGKFYRSALVAIRQRAGQQGADDIFKAAGNLIEKIDKKTGKGKASIEAMFAHPWAILPDSFYAIQGILERFSPGAFLEELFDSQSYLSLDENGIAMISIHGVIGQRLGLFDKLFGGISTEDLVADFERAINSPDVKGILLHIDSPGGMVDGTKEFADQVKASRGKKPIFAYTDSLMASAAYWIASAADEIWSTPTAQIGSIGVVAQHIDRSKAHEMMGIKRTYITSGKYKRMANDSEPLSEEGRQYIQELVDHIHGIFAGDVAANRKMSVEDVNATEARIYPAALAKDAGLVDQVNNFSGCYKILERRAGIMTKTEFKMQFSDLHKEIKEEAVGEFKASVKTAEDLCAQFPEPAGKLSTQKAEEVRAAERKRIMDIRGAAFPGQETLVDELIQAGASLDEAFKKILADEKTKRVKSLEELRRTDPGNLGSNLKGDDLGKLGTEDPEKKLEQLIQAKMEANKSLSYSAASKLVQKENPELAKAILEKMQKERNPA